MLINPISAVFRPDCDSSKRWIFNWIHWLIGNTGHICAITAIFLAYQMTTIRLQPAYLWSIAFYLFFHLTVHSLLELYFCNCRHNKGSCLFEWFDSPTLIRCFFVPESSDITKHGPEPSPHTSQRIDSLADTSFLRYFFALYSAVIFAFVITIIGIILFNWETKTVTQPALLWTRLVHSPFGFTGKQPNTPQTYPHVMAHTHTHQ